MTFVEAPMDVPGTGEPATDAPIKAGAIDASDTSLLFVIPNPGGAWNPAPLKYASHEACTDFGSLAHDSYISSTYDELVADKYPS